MNAIKGTFKVLKNSLDSSSMTLKRLGHELISFTRKLISGLVILAY